MCNLRIKWSDSQIWWNCWKSYQWLFHFPVHSLLTLSTIFLVAKCRGCADYYFKAALNNGFSKSIQVTAYLQNEVLLLHMSIIDMHFYNTIRSLCEQFVIFNACSFIFSSCRFLILGYIQACIWTCRSDSSISLLELLHCIANIVCHLSLA